MKSLDQKRTEAKERQEAYSSLSTKKKLLYLDMKFGENKGARKQRAKLKLQLAQEQISSQQSSKSDNSSNNPGVIKKKPYQKPKRS